MSDLLLPELSTPGKEGRMSIAADRRFLVLLTIALLAIVVLSLISFEVVTHMTVLLQTFHGVADSGPKIMQGHP